MPKRAVNKEEKREVQLFEMLKKTAFKYDTTAKNTIEKMVSNPEMIKDAEKIIKNRDTLDVDTINKLFTKYRDNHFIAPLLFECKNMPTEKMRQIIMDEATKLASTRTRWGNKERESICRGIFTADLSDEVRQECIIELVRLYTEGQYKNYMYYNMNSQTAMAIAKYAYNDLRQTDATISILKWIKADEYSSEYKIQEFLKELIETDLYPKAVALKMEDNYGELKELRTGYILNNPHINDEIMNIMQDNEDINCYNTGNKMTVEIADEVYDAAKATLFEKDATASDKEQASQMLTRLFSSKKFNYAMQYDLFDTMKREMGKTIDNYRCERIIARFIDGVNPKEMNIEALKLIVEFAPKGMKSRVFNSYHIPDSMKLECAPTYIETTKKNKILKSNKNLMITLRQICRLTTLDEKRYEQIKNCTLADATFKELKQEVATSPYTPTEVLQEYKKEEPNNIKIRIAIYAKENGFNAKEVDIMTDAVKRQYEGNLRKAGINIDYIDALCTGVKGLNIDHFCDYLRQQFEETPALDVLYGNNITLMQELAKSYQEEYNTDKEYYLSSVSPGQYYKQKIEDYIKRISENDRHSRRTCNQILKSIIETRDEYQDLAERKMGQSKAPKDKVKGNGQEIKEVEIAVNEKQGKHSSPQMMEDFLDEFR